MLARLYVEALLANEYLADQVWELWNAGVITDGCAARASAIILGWSIASRENCHGGESMRKA
jgi:hypothetical protein